MEGTMKVAVMTGKKKMEWCEREIPQPGPGELQIKLEYVGVCGSDLHFYSEGRLANWVPDGPLVLGHEPGGVVSAIGEGVTGFEIGDRVALEPEFPAVIVRTALRDIITSAGLCGLWLFPARRTGYFQSTVPMQPA